jgi:putative transposase
VGGNTARRDSLLTVRCLETGRVKGDRIRHQCLCFSAQGLPAPEVLGQLTDEHLTRLEKVWADGKSHNHHLDGWLVETKAGSVVEVVGHPAGSVGYVKLPRRWVVERTFAWLGRYRRNSRDDERFTESSEAMIKVSSIHRMLRLLKPDQSKKPVPFKYRELQENVTG